MPFPFTRRKGANPWQSLQLFGLVMLCASLWGSAFPIIKTVFNHWQNQGLEIDFATRSLFAGVRFSCAGLFLLLIAKKPIHEFRETPLKLLAVLILTQTIGQYFFFYLGLSVASGSLAALLVSTGSFWWVILAPLFLKTPPPTSKQWALLIMGATGVSLAVYAPGTGVGNPVLGAILILAANLCGALGVITFQSVKYTMGARAGTGFSLFCGGLVLSLMGVTAMDKFPILFDSFVILRTAWLAFVSASAFSLWYHLSTLYPVNLLATYRFLIPVCGVIESIIILGESPGWGLLLGGVLVIIAMAGAQAANAARLPNN